LPAFEITDTQGGPVLAAMRGSRPGPAVPPGLSAQLEAWPARSAASAVPPATVLRALLAWTRLHGVLSLELDGHLTATGIDPALLYQAEVDFLAG
jgi:hypothetical protein